MDTTPERPAIAVLILHMKLHPVFSARKCGGERHAIRVKRKHRCCCMLEWRLRLTARGPPASVALRFGCGRERVGKSTAHGRRQGARDQQRLRSRRKRRLGDDCKHGDDGGGVGGAAPREATCGGRCAGHRGDARRDLSAPLGSPTPPYRQTSRRKHGLVKVTKQPTVAGVTCIGGWKMNYLFLSWVAN
jgi:hypothetical protein